jgi:hypothetical protein
MTGYKSKKAAAIAKTIDEVNWADHEPNGLAQPAQEPEYRCCPHDFDCAVHNMPAYPAGPCDCSYSNTFNLPPSSAVHEVCLKLATRELEKITNENFGRTPNDAWTNKIVDVYHFFESNPKAKKLTEIYTTPPQPAQEPVAWVVYDKRGGSKSLHWPEQHSPNGDATMFDAIPLVPQRPWIGLTDEEIAEGIKQSWVTAQAFQSAAWWAEAKLKEKNT